MPSSRSALSLLIDFLRSAKRGSNIYEAPSSPFASVPESGSLRLLVEPTISDLKRASRREGTSDWRGVQVDDLPAVYGTAAETLHSSLLDRLMPDYRLGQDDIPFPVRRLRFRDDNFWQEGVPDFNLSIKSPATKMRGRVHTGPSHQDIQEYLTREYLDPRGIDVAPMDLGFETSGGDFVDAIEAADIARAATQPLSEAGKQYLGSGRGLALLSEFLR